MSVEQFLSLSHNPEGIKPGLDRHLDEIQSRTNSTDRIMLRVCFWLLSNIGKSMPWNVLDGIDARRFNEATNYVAPSWRDCIGAILGISYDPPHPHPEEDLNEADLNEDQDVPDGTEPEPEQAE